MSGVRFGARGVLPAALLLTTLLAAPLIAAPVGAPSPLPDLSLCGGFAAVPEVGAPAYYAIELVPTGRVAGMRRARGWGQLTFPQSAFGIQLGDAGEYVYDLAVSISDLPVRHSGKYAVWLTTPRLDRVRLLGGLDAHGQLQGRVPWNKFLVVITLESELDDSADGWSGPILLRGMSRSGRMHTMAGHGPYQSEPCIVYGY